AVRRAGLAGAAHRLRAIRHSRAIAPAEPACAERRPRVERGSGAWPARASATPPRAPAAAARAPPATRVLFPAVEPLAGPALRATPARPTTARRPEPASAE